MVLLSGSHTRRTILSALSQFNDDLLGLAFPLMFPIRSHTNNVYPYFTCLLSTTDWYFLLYHLLLNVCTGTTAFPQLSSQCPILEKLKLCFLNISTAGLTVWNFLHLSSSPDFMNLFLVTWETFVLNLHISHLLILYVITFTVIVLFLMPTSSSPSWLQFGNSGIISACTLLCNNCHIHVHANCDSVFIYLNNILIWLCCF